MEKQNDPVPLLAFGKHGMIVDMGIKTAGIEIIPTPGQQTIIHGNRIYS